jgi:hypothetical protein
LRLSRAEDGPETTSRLSRRLAGCSPCTARLAAASLTVLLASRLLRANVNERRQCQCGGCTERLLRLVPPSSSSACCAGCVAAVTWYASCHWQALACTMPVFPVPSIQLQRKGLTHMQQTVLDALRTHMRCTASLRSFASTIACSPKSASLAFRTPSPSSARAKPRSVMSTARSQPIVCTCFGCGTRSDSCQRSGRRACAGGSAECGQRGVPRHCACVRDVGGTCQQAVLQLQVTVDDEGAVGVQVREALRQLRGPPQRVAVEMHGCHMSAGCCSQRDVHACTRAACASCSMRPLEVRARYDALRPFVRC